MLKTIVKFTRYLLGVVVIVGALLLICRVNNFIFVCEIKAFQHTLTEQRELGHTIEQTAMTDRLIDMNTDIAKKKVLANLPVVRHFYIQEFRDIQVVK